MYIHAPSNLLEMLLSFLPLILCGDTMCSAPASHDQAVMEAHMACTRPEDVHLFMSEAEIHLFPLFTIAFYIQNACRDTV